MRRLLSSPAAHVAAIVAAYCATLWLSITHLRGPDGSIALFFSNGSLLAGLLLLRGRWRWLSIAGCVLGCTILLWPRSATPFYPIGTGLIAGFACLSGYYLGRLVLRQPRIRTANQAILVLALVVAPSALVSAALSSLWLHFLIERPFITTAFQWFMASLVGSSIVLITTLVLAGGVARHRVKRSRVERGFFALLLGGLTVGAFVGLYPIVLALIFPVVHLVALRLSSRATAIAASALSLAMIIAPFVTSDSAMSSAPPQLAALVVLGLQGAALAVFFSGVLTSLTIGQQARTKRRLEYRAASARRARADALRASKAKTEFLATMSHEIRTPLNAVLGFAQLLDQRKDLPADARRQVSMIRCSGESLLTVVNDILDFSKVEAGKLSLDPRPVHLPTLAEESLAIVGPAAAEKGLAFDLCIEGIADERHVVDDHRLRQVLLNFLNNAVKFTDRGRIDLRLSVRTVADGRDMVRIAVTDTGTGIPPEAKDRLFQRFSQADSSISRSHGGAGLGLAICKSLVDLMGGQVGVDSMVGRGSTFWLEVPLMRTDVDGGAVGSPEGDQALAAHILLVDDNAANRELGVTVLTLLGCSAETARDGREAVEAASARSFDLILMDVHMPGMDGLAATRAIRALEGPAAATPIIAMTADVLPEQVARCHAAGMVDHIAKPIDVARLAEQLGRWLSESSSSDGLAA